MYHLGNQVDRAFRNFSAGAIRSLINQDDLIALYSEMSDATNDFSGFLDMVCVRFKQEAQSTPDYDKLAPDMRIYSGIMKEIAQSGVCHVVDVTTNIGNDTFNLIKHVETIVKICERFGQSNFFAAQSVIKEINNQIDIFAITVKKCNTTFIHYRENKKRNKPKKHVQKDFQRIRTAQ